MIDDYSALLSELEQYHPLLVTILRQAERNRAQSLQRYLHGVRLTGFEQFLAHMRIVEQSFRDHVRFSKIAFLITRIRLDFETAIELAFTGFDSVVADTMRDVMETEFLLRDFHEYPTHIEEWLTLSDKERRKKFAPAKLRERFAMLHGPSPSEERDYSAHSIALHVTPDGHPLLEKGFAENQPLISDLPFWEIFEHARRIVMTVYFLLDSDQSSVVPNPHPENDLAEFKVAWERTQDRQGMYLALLEAAEQVRQDREQST